jgi:coniferyl-aldehyde dehydrogenase
MGALMRDILVSQRAAFLREGPPTLTQRKRDLSTLKTAILAHRSAIETAAREDFGYRSRHDTTILELFPIVRAIDYQRRRLGKWMKPERRWVPIPFQTARAWVSYQPLGVVGIVSPWNYPVSLALQPLATAIAAGNRAMIKPSELAPASSAFLAKIIADAFPQEQVAVVTGGAEVARDFAALPFDHLIFTGSTSVGRAVMKAASENLVPVTLELGGKSPAIVDRRYSLRHAAIGIAWGKLVNSGQTCIAPDYAMVHEDSVEPFVEAFDRAVRELYPDGPAADDYTTVVSENHFARLRAMLDDARRKGATLREVGADATSASRRAHNLAPTVITGVTDDMRIMQEEIFGPLLPVVTYREIDEAIAYVNARPRPLALYFFGGVGPNRQKVLSRTTSGDVTINNTLMHYAQEYLPFGGVGSSGFGAYHGVDGFKTLSHAKGVFDQGRWSLNGLLRPPYGRFANAILKLLLR